MNFVRAEKCGPYVVYVSGTDGREVQAQIYSGSNIKRETTCITKQAAEKWATAQLELLRLTI